jgi:hypothetical protein
LDLDEVMKGRRREWDLGRVLRYAIWAGAALAAAMIWLAMVVKTILCLVEEVSR